MKNTLYTLEFAPRAEWDFKKLDVVVQRRLRPKIDNLAKIPRPNGVEKLTGEENLYRIRVGDYRIIYKIYDNRLTVLLVKIGHRREVYR